MAGGLRTPYKPSHGLKFGLEVSERNPTTSAVVSAGCLFCVKVGRATANDSSRKRGRTENVQYYRVPFSTDNMKTHAEKQHPDAFEECSSLGVTEKKSNFDDVNRKNILHAHLDGEKPLRFMINKDIVDVVIGEMLFDPDDVKQRQRVREPSRSSRFSRTPTAAKMEIRASTWRHTKLLSRPLVALTLWSAAYVVVPLFARHLDL
jgi:hypothetical protein